MVNIDTSTANAFVAEGSTVRTELKNFVNDNQMVMTQTAYDEFSNIIATIGGPLEKARALRFLNKVSVVPDTPSERAKSLKITRTVKLNDIIIFGTGDALGITTMSADARFVRASQSQGVDFDVFLHSPFSLVGK